MTKHIKKVSGLSRREVLVGSAAGAGLVIGYSVLPNAVDSASKAIAAGNWDHQQFLTMDADGKATVHITKCEIGQHVGTALAQAVAEELGIKPALLTKAIQVAFKESLDSEKQDIEELEELLVIAKQI